MAAGASFPQLRDVLHDSRISRSRIIRQAVGICAFVQIKGKTHATSEAGGRAGGAEDTRKASDLISRVFHPLHTLSAAATCPTTLPLTNCLSRVSPSQVGSSLAHADLTTSTEAAHNASDIHPATGVAAAGPRRSASALAPATAAGGKSAFVRRAAAAFSILLAEDVIADVVSSSRWLLRDDGASFRSLCQQLRVYEAAVLRAIRFDVCPTFIPLPAIRLYVKLFLVKCRWCCLASPASAAAGRSVCSRVTSETSVSCSLATKPTTHCCSPAAELSHSPSGCCTIAYTKSVPLCLCVSSNKTLPSSCSCLFQNRDTTLLFSCPTAPATGESYSVSCSSTACRRCCCSSTYVDTRCCCREWPAAGLPYLQLQRRLHAEALQQLLFLCRTPFLIERSPNAVAAACVIKAAIECGLPFLISAQQQIKLAAATWRQLQRQNTVFPAAPLQKTEKRAQHDNAHQSHPAKVKQDIQEQRATCAEEEKLRPFPKPEKPEKGSSFIIGTVGQQAALLALESFDRHVTHFMHAINHPHGSCAAGNGCCGGSAVTGVAATSHEFTGTAWSGVAQSKTASATTKSHEVVYGVDSEEVRRVLAELRLASTWMGELLRVTGAQATSLMQPVSKKEPKKQAKRVKFDESGVSGKDILALHETSAAAGMRRSSSDTGCNPAATVGGCASARGVEPGCAPCAAAATVHTPPRATIGRISVARGGVAVAERSMLVGAAGDGPAAALGTDCEAVARSVEEVLLQETVKLGGRQEQAIQQKRLKRCMEYIRNVLGKRPSDEEHFTAAPPKPEVKQPLHRKPEEEDVLQLYRLEEQTHTRPVKGSNKSASVY